MNLPKSRTKSRKGVLSASLIARFSGVRRDSVRVVLAIPGAHRYPLESGVVADMARRAAVLGEVMSPVAEVEAWIYTARAYRLPNLRLADAERWIADWAVLPKEPLLSRDAVPGNSLGRGAEEYGLFDAEDAAEAVKGITQSLPESEVATLVLFYFWGLHSEGTALADQFDAGAGRNVFWLFLGDLDGGSSVLDDLDALRAEAPHIRNVSLYRGWDAIEETPDHSFWRGVLNPFARWRKGYPAARR